MKRLALIFGIVALATLSSAQISFKFYKTKTSDVVASISRLTNVTIVTPAINTPISLRAKNVTVSRAINILNAQLGLMHYGLFQEIGS